MYKIKILTHVIRLDDGHVMPDWINVKAGQDPKVIKQMVKDGRYDTDKYAIRMRRYPKEKHSVDVELWPESKLIGSPRRMW